MKQAEMIGFRLINFLEKRSSLHKVTPVLLRPLFDFCSKNTPVLAAISRAALSQIAYKIEFSVLPQKKPFCVHWLSTGYRDAFGVFGTGFWRTQNTIGARFLVKKLPKWPTFRCDISAATLAQPFKLSDQEHISTHRAL